MNKNTKISTEIGTIGLLCISLFFICQIIGAEAFYDAVFSGPRAATVEAAAAPSLSEAKSAALQMTSTLENSTTKLQFNYAENINDGRGITFGIIGFCTGTYDGNVLIKYYTTLNPNNVLAKYIPALNAIDAGAHNTAGGDGNASVAGLTNFVADVQKNTDPLFQQAQLYEMDQLYWNPAVLMFNKIGAKNNLTLAFIYDMSIRHGADGAQSIISSATSQLGGVPVTGISENIYLAKLIALRDAKLKGENLGDVDRNAGFKAVLASGNVGLVTPYAFTAYGESFTVVANASAVSTDGSTVPAAPVALSAAIVPNTVTEVEKGATNVQLIAIKITNTGVGDALLSQISIPGSYAPINETNTTLYSGNTKIGVPSTRFDSKVIFSGLKIAIAKGASVTLSLKGDIATTNIRTSMTYSLGTSTDFVAKGSSGTAGKITVTAGSSVLKIKAVAVPVKKTTLTAAFVPNTISSAAKGGTNVQLIAVKVTNTGTEDLNLPTIEIPGNYNVGDVTNLALYTGDAKIATPTSVSSSVVAFRGMKLSIVKGASITLLLKGDIVKTTNKNSLIYRWVNVGGILAKDAALNTAKVTVVSGSSVLAIAPAPPVASLNIAFAPRTITIKRGDKGAVLQEMKLKNELNRVASIKVTSFDVKTSVTGNSAAAVNFDAVYLYLGDKQIAKGTNGNTKLVFDTDINLPANGSGILTLKGDVGAGAVSQTLTFTMNFDMNVTSGGILTNTPTLVTGTPSIVKILPSTIKTITTLTASIVPNTIDLVVPGTSGVQLIAVKIANTGTEDLTLTNFEVPGNYSTLDLANPVLYAGDVKIATAAKITDTNVVFSGLTIAIAKGMSVTLVLKGDVSKTTTKTLMTYSLKNSGDFVAKDILNNNAKVTIVSGKSVLAIAAAPVAVSSLTAAVVPDTITSAVKGTKNVQFLAVKFTNTGSEDVTLTKTGTFNNNASVGNMAFYVDEVRKAESTTGTKKYSFDTKIEKGKAVVMVLKGDVLNTATAGSIIFVLDTSATAISAKGVTSNKTIAIAYGGVSSTVTVASTDTPAAVVKIKINKVFYNTDAAHMAGTCPYDNEWFELYNAGEGAVNIKGWKVCDGQACDSISTGDLSIPAKGFAMVTNKDTTWKLWTIPSTVVKVSLKSEIGDGLYNVADMLAIKDASGKNVDQINWGTPKTSWTNYNSILWNPGYAAGGEGSIFSRITTGADTDKMTDWTIGSALSMKIGQWETIIKNFKS